MVTQQYRYLDEENGIFYVDDQDRVWAEVDFPAIGEGVVDINHTYVNPALRGQGLAATLLEHAVAQLRKTGTKAVPTCSFAKEWFGEHPEAADVLA